MALETEKIEEVELDSIEDFLPMPGAESIVTAGEEKNTMFAQEKEETISLEEMEDSLKDIIPSMDDELEVEITDIKKTTTKSENTILKKLIENQVLIPFDDDKKSIDDYTQKDWEELFKANLEEKEKEIVEKTQKDFFEALPEELKYAATYVANGGTDMKGLLRALSQSEEVHSLDVNNPSHQQHIVRNYLYAKNFGEGNKDLIEEQLEEWVEAGTIAKKASQFKPILDQMQEEVVKSKIAQQETFKKEQLEKKDNYLKNIHSTLQVGELGGVKIDGKRQNMLWNEMTTTKYQSMTGRPTNLLGKLLEDYQFGEKPRYDLIAEALWLLADPDDYKSKLQQSSVNKVVEETAKKLKTEESRKTSGSSIDDLPDGEKKRTIKRTQTDFFKR